MAAESEMAVNLAADILKEHFGESVERVGKVLLSRGALTVQELMRFTEEATDQHQEPLGFPHVRNALLVLVQHNLVLVRPHPVMLQRLQQDFIKLYSMDVESVLCRLRFPHYIEHCYWHFGDVASEMMASVLRNGRITAAAAMNQSSGAVKQSSPKELESEFRRLLDENVLRHADPLAGTPTFPNNGEGGGLAAKKPEEAAEAAGKRRRLDQEDAVETQGQAGAAAASSSTAPAEPIERSMANSTNIYFVNCRMLNLAMCKDMLCRLVGERVNPYAGQVLAAALTGVKANEKERRGAVVEYMSLAKLEDRMKKLGAHTAGRDPAKEREKLRKVLEMMTAHKHGLMKRRLVHSSGEQVPEWGVEWTAARQLVVSSTISQLIRDQFGQYGLRIYNLLTEQTPPQRLEESHIFQTCMIPPCDGRDVLNEMCRRSIVHWQEVPRSATSPLIASFWLFYVDLARLEHNLLWNVYQATLAMRVRFRQESALVYPLEARRASLTKKERQTLKEGRRTEDVLERSFLVLDAAALVLRSF